MLRVSEAFNQKKVFTFFKENPKKILICGSAKERYALAVTPNIQKLKKIFEKKIVYFPDPYTIYLIRLKVDLQSLPSLILRGFIYYSGFRAGRG